MGFETVIVVDDDEGVRDSLQALLEAMDYEVRCFESGDQLLQARDLPRRVCVLLDYNLPGKSGLEVMAALSAQGPRPPIVLISGDASPRVKSLARTRGAIASLDKPVNDDRLLAVLETAFHHWRAEEGATAARQP